MEYLRLKVLVVMATCIMFSWSYPDIGRPQTAATLELAVQLAERIQRLQKFVIDKLHESLLRHEYLKRDVNMLKQRKWKLKRIKYNFPLLPDIEVAPDSSRDYRSGLPYKWLPRNTRAILLAIKCGDRKGSSNPTVKLGLKQTGDTENGESVYIAPVNDFYYETIVPWDKKFENGVTFSYEVKGTTKNRYSLSLIGYITD